MEKIMTLGKLVGVGRGRGNVRKSDTECDNYDGFEAEGHL